MQTTKRCSRCNQEKPVTAFHRHSLRADGLQSHCKECRRDTSNASPRRKEVRVASEHRNKEKIAAKKAAWFAKNAERLREVRKAARARHYEKHRGKCIAYVRARQKHIQALTAGLPQAEQAEIEGVYFFCRIFPQFEVDHIIPLRGKTVCGLHVPANLQALEARANRRKGNSHDAG